jgi:hypothetical protein
MFSMPLLIFIMQVPHSPSRQPYVMLAPTFSDISMRRVPAGTETVMPNFSKVTFALGMRLLQKMKCA